MKKIINVFAIALMLVTLSCTKGGLKSIRFVDESVAVMVGFDTSLPVETDPADFDVSLLEWKSSDESVAVVNDGYVHGVASGFARITVSSGRKSAGIDVYVNDVIVSSFTVPSYIDVAPGYSTTFKVTSIKPEYAKIENLRFSPGQSDDLTLSFSENVVTVAAGKGMANGSKGSISVSNADGSLEKKIVVYYTYRPVTAVSLNVTSAAMTIGETKTVSATVTPSNATDGALTWTVSNPAIISYDSDTKVLKALSAGTATLTAKAGEKSAVCNVTVTGVPIEGRNVMFTGTENAETFTVPGQSSVQWTSSNTSVATVNSDGLVTGKATGWVTITATYSGTKSEKELRVVGKNCTPDAYCNRLSATGHKDKSGVYIYRLELPVTNAYVLPSYGTATFYLGVEGYTLTNDEIKELSGGKMSYFKAENTGDPFRDGLVTIMGELSNSYVQSSLNGTTTTTLTGPNGQTSTLTWHKTITSLSLSTTIGFSSIKSTVPVGDTFTVTSTGNYYIWVNPRDYPYEDQMKAVGRSVIADADFKYTLVCKEDPNLLSTSAYYQCVSIKSTTAKGTYSFYISEYPSITFKIKYQ